MKSLFSDLLNKIQSWGESLFLMLPNLIVAVLVFLLAVFISRKTKRLFGKAISKISDNKTVNKLISNILSAIVIMIGIFVSFEMLNLDKAVTSLLAGAGVAGLAVSLAFKDPVLNIVSGISLSIKKYINIGDQIETNGFTGTVKEIKLSTTNITTFTGEDLSIPNNLIIQQPLMNYTRTKERRVDLSCGVSYSDDLEKVIEIVENTIKNEIDTDKSKEINVFFEEFGGSSINFVAQFWMSTSEQFNYLRTRSKAIIAIKKAFDKEGIDIPFPIRTINFTNGLSLEK
jgi:small conductance mechanosensitive channel